MENEEILLQTPRNPVEDVDKVSFGVTTQTVVQEQKLAKRKQTLVVYDDRYLNVERVDGEKKTSYYLHLMFLGIEPVHEITTKWIYWYVAMALISLSSGLFYLHDNSIALLRSDYLLPLSMLSMAGGIVMIIMLFYTHQSTYIYTTHTGNAPVLKMMYDNPSVSDFLIFSHYMKLCVVQSREKSQHTQTQRLAMELKEHRRLRDEKIISSEVYETAKERIMAEYE